MRHPMEKVLLLDDGGTQVLPLARSLYKLGYEVHATTPSRLTYSNSSRFVRKHLLFPEMKDKEQFTKYIKSLLSSGDYLSVIPLDDNSAEIISENLTEIKKYVKIVAPDRDVFRQGYDKHLLMDLCEKNNYPHPPTAIINKRNVSKEEILHLQFPVLIKPNITCGGRGMTLVKTPDELVEKFPTIYDQFGDCHVQSYIPQGGAQVEVQLYVNEKKELIQSSVIYKYRWYPENGGSSCCNKSTENRKIVDICYSILKDLDWVGFADFDTIEDPRTGELLIMEINPRLPACVKSTFAAGIDWGNVLINEYQGENHPCFKMEKEVFLRHFGMEMLWFFHSKKRFTTKPSWFKFLGKKVFYQDASCWTDPLPFIYGTLGNFMKQLSPEFRKSKAGTR